METAKARRAPRREYFALLGSTAGQKASPKGPVTISVSEDAE